jgi:hypothetical protein
LVTDCIGKKARASLAKRPGRTAKLYISLPPKIVLHSRLIERLDEGLSAPKKPEEIRQQPAVWADNTIVHIARFLLQGLEVRAFSPIKIEANASNCFSHQSVEWKHIHERC